MENKNAELHVKGIKCDNPNCDYSDMDVKVEEYESWIDKPCPKCGENLLTQENYDLVQTMLLTTELMNSLTPEQAQAIANSATEEDIDAALDMINGLKLKMKGKDEQGREIWSTE